MNVALFSNPEYGQSNAPFVQVACGISLLLARKGFPVRVLPIGNWSISPNVHTSISFRSWTLRANTAILLRNFNETCTTKVSS